MQTIGRASAAASNTLFLIPTPLTNGITATARSHTAFRKSGTSASSSTPSEAHARRTLAVGANPITVNRAAGTAFRTSGHTRPTNQSTASSFGPNSNRPQKAQVFGTSTAGTGAKNSASTPFGITSTAGNPASVRMARRSRSDTTHPRSTVRRYARSYTPCTAASRRCFHVPRGTV